MIMVVRESSVPLLPVVRNATSPAMTATTVVTPVPTLLRRRQQLQQQLQRHQGSQ